MKKPPRPTNIQTMLIAELLYVIRFVGVCNLFKVITGIPVTR